MSETEIIVSMDKHIKIKGGHYKQDLVRCKECKHRPKKVEDEGNGFDYEFPEEYGCPGYCEDGYYSKRFADDFFCGYGEKR